MTKMSVSKNSTISHNAMSLLLLKKPEIKCRICHKTFKFRCKMEEHVKEIHNKKPYNCSQCSKKFSNIYAFRIHTKQTCESIPSFFKN